jgi:hypothetical protein
MAVYGVLADLAYHVLLFNPWGDTLRTTEPPLCYVPFILVAFRVFCGAAIFRLVRAIDGGGFPWVWAIASFCPFVGVYLFLGFNRIAVRLLCDRGVRANSFRLLGMHKEDISRLRAQVRREENR